MGAVKTALLDQPDSAARVSAAATGLARALSRLLSATVDTDLADGLGLSIGAAGAREQSLDALAQWEDARHG
ncbi:hypothetical protein [Sphingobium cupriresistens]|uniref:hypothetical protein n=1 Tax=Sphingobium cupriresistens TaxID=1132417 RepID=UPI003BAE109F